MNEKTKLDIIKYRTDKALETLTAIESLIENELYDMAVNRIYYAGFYILNALALLDGFETSKHKQLIGYFNKEYINTGKLGKKYGKIINKAFDNRSTSDYVDFVEIVRDEVINNYSEIKEFVKTINDIIQSRITD